MEENINKASVMWPPPRVTIMPAKMNTENTSSQLVRISSSIVRGQRIFAINARCFFDGKASDQKNAEYQEYILPEGFTVEKDARFSTGRVFDRIIGKTGEWVPLIEYENKTGDIVPAIYDFRITKELLELQIAAN
jgi:hypothetical protein